MKVINYLFLRGADFTPECKKEVTRFAKDILQMLGSINNIKIVTATLLTDTSPRDSKSLAIDSRTGEIYTKVDKSQLTTQYFGLCGLDFYDIRTVPKQLSLC